MLAACAACAEPGPGPLVSAPSAPVAPVAAEPRPSAAPPGEGAPAACSQSWTLADMSGGPGRVVVVCGSDVRRASLDPVLMARAIDPALGPARERVCACASRMPAPEYVDLVVTSTPDDGRASVEASEPDEELDPALAPAFVACVGKLATTFPRAHAQACDGADKATFVYPLHVELNR